MFKETVLQIEGENISAIDVAHHVEELRGSLMLQKEDRYLAPLVKSERNKLMSDDESGFENVLFEANVNEFFDVANNYLADWTEQFDQIRKYWWVSLRVMPAWNQIEETMEEIPQFDLNEHSNKVHVQYGHIKSYCTAEKLAEWNAEKLPAENRWVEIFNHMNTAQVPYLNFARIIEFILCSPGSSAPVERVFSLIKNIWKAESGNLGIDTLKAILLVKCNLDYSCIDFYQFLKKQPQLLRQIANQEKYNFKAPRDPSSIVSGNDDEAGGSSNMSVDSAQTEDEVDS